MASKPATPTETTSPRDLSTLNVRALLEEAALDVPDEIVLVHGDERVDYREFNRRVDRAAAVWHDLGVRKGDRVAFVLENRPEFLYAWLGLAKIGGILVACNTRWQASEIEDFLTLTEPTSALIGDRFGDLFSSVAPHLPSLRHVLSAGGDGPEEDFYRLMQQTKSVVPGVHLVASDPISFISTSGTTGRPKAVIQTHGNFVLTGEGYAAWVALARGERLYLCLPLFHINSQAYTVMGAIAARSTMVLVERFSASRFWSDMNQYGINVFNYIGSMLAVLLKREPTPEERSHAVRITYGGPALPGPLRDEVERRFHLTVISGIGMSETTFGLIESPRGERRPGSLGTPRQHPDPRIVNEAKVVDDSGNEVPAGEVGELIYRNPVMMQGYYRNPEGTAEVMRNGWLYTGDLVRCDDDGFFYFVDRKKDIIRVRGENVSSAEVESALMEHPAVLETAVVGIPSPLTDEDVAAFVVLRGEPRVDAHGLQEWCAGRLASFKVPRFVWFVDALPKTETQRAEKPRLRAMAADLLEREKGIAGT